MKAILQKANFDLIGRMINVTIQTNIAGNIELMDVGSSLDEVKLKNLPFFESLAVIVQEKIGIEVELNEELKNFIALG